jgi:citrate synthase
MILKIKNEKEAEEYILSSLKKKDEKLKGKYLVPIDLQKIGVSLLAAYDETWYAQIKEELYFIAMRMISKVATMTARA